MKRHYVKRPSSRHIGSRVNRGFTLLELVTTLIIVAILSAIAAPRFFDNQAFAQRGYVDELASSLRYAQRIAVASNCEVAAIVNAGNYSALQRSTELACNQNGPWTTQVRRSDGSAVRGIAPNDVTVAPAGMIVFDPDGSVQNIPPVFSVGPFTVTTDRDTGIVTVEP